MRRLPLLRTDRRDLVLLMAILLVPFISLFPSRAFFFSYAWIFKLYYLSIALAGSLYLQPHPLHPIWRWAAKILLITFLFNALTTSFLIRSLSSLDPLLASIAAALLFWTYGQRCPTTAFRTIGIVFFTLTAFSLCLYTSHDAPYPYTYNWKNLWQNTVGQPWRFLGIFSRKNANYYPFEYSNYTGIFCVLTLPYLAGLLFYDPSKKWKYFWAVAVGLSLAEEITADSRAAHLLLLAGFLLALFLYLKYSKRIPQKWIKTIGWASLITVGGIVFSSPDLKRTILGPLRGDFRPITNTRLDALKDGWVLFRERPWLGHGMDTTVFTYFRGFLSSSSVIPFSSWQLHVAPIEYLVNWGIFGALGLVLLVVGAIHMWYRLFFHTSSPDKILATASFIGIILYTGFWSDWSLHLFAICVSLSLLGGTLHFLYRRHFQPSAQRSPGDSKIFAGLWMTLLGLCIYVSYKDLRGRYFFRKGIQSYELSMAEKYVSKALTYDSKNYHYYNQLGNVFLRLAPYSELIRRKALAFFRKSLEINPYQLYPYENLGALYTFEKRYGLAYEYYFRAIYLNPARSLAYIQLVDILYRNHFDDLADRWTALACFLQPELIQTEFMADGFLKRAPVQEYFFALLRRAQKDVAEGRITALTEEDLELREFIFKTLLHQKHPLLKTLSGENLPPRKKELKKKIIHLFKKINLSVSSLEHVHEKCAAGYIPFGNGLFYPEDHILYATVEKVRMHNLDGPALHLCSPRTLYWHPLLSKYVPYLRFHYGNPYARSLPREAYKNPFEEDDLEEIKSLPF